MGSKSPCRITAEPIALDDLSRFALPRKDVKPRLVGVKVERLYLTEAKALIGHSTDAVTLHIDSGVELHDVISQRWSAHPFSQPGAILGVTLVADFVFDGETAETPLSIVVTEPGRCSLQGEKDDGYEMQEHNCTRRWVSSSPCILARELMTPISSGKWPSSSKAQPAP